MSQRPRIAAFVNLAHAYDHLFMLLYATVVLALESEFHNAYGTLLLLSMAGFVAFAAGTLPAGWLGDRWSRHGMLTIFFAGIGCSSVLTGLARTPLEIGIGLGLIGLFASIYHPVGTALVVQGTRNVGKALGVNGFFGNLGVAGAALIAGVLTDTLGWRAAFIVPGLIALATGIAFALLVPRVTAPAAATSQRAPWRRPDRAIVRVFAVIAVATVCGGIVFNATTVALPKVFDERLPDLAVTTMSVGGLASLVFVIAAFAQIAVGHLIDRYPIKPIFLILVAVQVPALLAAGALDGLAMLLAAGVAMALIFGEIAIIDTLVARATVDAWRSRVYAVKYVLSLGVSVLAIPLVAVLHGTEGGFGAMFAILAMLALVIAVAVTALPGGRVAANPDPAIAPSAPRSG